MIFPIAISITLFVVDSRSLVLISNVPEQLSTHESHFCPVESEDGPEEEEIPPGCELVVRAYKLGYSKSLGDCEKAAKKEEEEGRSAKKGMWMSPICTIPIGN